MTIKPRSPARLTAWVAGGLALVGVLALAVGASRMVPAVDLAVTRWAAEHASESSTALLLVITSLGASVVVGAACIVVGALDYRRHRILMVPVFLALTLGGQMILVNLIKDGVDRSRPAFEQLVDLSGPSFPSGHAAAAAAGYAALVLVLGRGRSAASRRRLMVVAVLIALTVAATRVLLGAHWSTDVIAGLAFGWTWCAFCSLVFWVREPALGSPDGHSPAPATDGEIRETDAGVRGTDGGPRHADAGARQ